MNFEQQLRLAGLHPRDVKPDGKIYRCTTESKPTKRNGWYCLHLDGRGVWGDWTTGSGEAIGHWQDDQASTRVVDESKVRAQRDKERAYRIKSMREARTFWERSRPIVRPHPYLERKALTTQGCAGLRQHDGLLVVPVLQDKWISSVQTITDDGVKRFWPGAPVKSGAYILDRSRAAITAICEGLATGLAIFQSVKNCRVLVAFDAGNLLPVVQRIKPHGSVVLVADNDHKTAARIGSNPGIVKARNAAELIGCGVVWFDGIEGSDAADALKEWGVGADRRIERAIHAGMRYVDGADNLRSMK